MDVMQRIDDTVKNNSIVIFMKGTPKMPSCGFSARAAEALLSTGVEFSHVNVLTDPEIFENLPRYADWPTFPQIYINHELAGGGDIVLEMLQNGQLKSVCEAAVTADNNNA
jgi:monothiol glutaredoxin